MPAKIRVLDESVINQIAAGEIIENPASLVKELVENSIDANATKISIDIVGGGLLFIEVSDDGCGMGKDDAILALERHATSKISKFQDLEKLRSMGFRGEALASISGVSKFELETAEEGQIGTKVVCNGGKIISAIAFPRRKGTTIKVTDLFYNVPARRKFQKSSSQLTLDIVKMVTKIALAHKSIAFSLTSHGKVLISTSHQEEKRIEEVLGKGFLIDTKEIFFQNENYRIQGVVGTPLNVRSNRLQQYLLINKRPVLSQLVEKAVQTAYGTMIGSKDYPVFALWLEVPPDRLDVNIHPQKSVVRFSEEEKVYSFVKCGVEKVFFVETKKMVFPKIEMPSTQVVIDSVVVAPSFAINEQKLIEEEIEVLTFYEDIAIVKVPPISPIFSEEKLIFVDSVKLDTKIQFHQMFARISEGKEGEKEMLLFPEVLKVTKEEEIIILKHEELLKKIGLGIRPFGKESFILDAISPMLSLEKVRKLLDLLLLELNKEFNLEAVIKIVSNFRSPRILSKDELKHMLKQLFSLKDPFYTPNGSLIFSIFNKEEMFGKK